MEKMRIDGREVSGMERYPARPQRLLRFVASGSDGDLPNLLLSLGIMPLTAAVGAGLPPDRVSGVMVY